MCIYLCIIYVRIVELFLSRKCSIKEINFEMNTHTQTQKKFIIDLLCIGKRLTAVAESQGCSQIAKKEINLRNKFSRENK
jgi:hypothetical protein